MSPKPGRGEVLAWLERNGRFNQKKQILMSEPIQIRSRWQIWLMLAAPSLLIGVVILLFVIVGTRFLQLDSDQVSLFVRSRLALIIAINHTSVLALLLIVLKKNSLTLREIGWRMPRKSLLMEIAIGFGAGLVLYLFKELIYDSTMALLDGMSPTFNSLFNFHLTVGDLPMILVATSLVFVEESIFRGFGIQALSGRFGILRAVAFTSIFFGFLHWGNGWTAIVYTSIAGLYFAGLFLWREKNLLPGTVAHALYNLLVLLT